MATFEQQVDTVRLELLVSDFGLVSRALEFYSRLGIGQFEQIEELCRKSVLSRDDFPFKALNFVDQHAAALKGRLLDLGQGQSHGIHSAHVAPVFAQSWQWTKAMKHRHAWDFHKDGRQGVWHQDPGQVAGFAVSSQGQGADWRCIVEIDAGHLPQLRTVLETFNQAHLGQYHFLLDWARDGVLREADGKIPSLDVISDCLPVLSKLQQAISGLGQPDGFAEIQQSLERLIGLCGERAIEDRPRRG